MTDDINTKLEDLNIQLDEASTPAGSYVPYVISNNLVFISILFTPTDAAFALTDAAIQTIRYSAEAPSEIQHTYVI